MKVILASKNAHKLEELSAILGQLGFEIALESEYGLDIEVEETGTTFEENSLLKAEAVMKASRAAGAGRRFGPDGRCAPRRAGRLLRALRP